MKQSHLIAMTFLLLAAAPNWAADPHSAKETQADVARHRSIAAAHEAAAKCLESGQSKEVCHKALLAACKGLAIGKYCGMKHSH